MNLEMRNMPDHYPQRDDQVEAWLKERRNEWDFNSTVFSVLDDLLDEYRLAADTGRSLENVVNGDEAPEPVEVYLKRKKKLARPDPINTEDLA